MPASDQVAELFRNTVAVADTDPPNMEFRVMRQLEWQDKPDAFYVGNSKLLALRELKQVRAYHDYTYTGARVWMEQRSVSEWKEVE